jgi:Cys-tRNA(Pro)/Cys-tRNA(Cys) deacylase
LQAAEALGVEPARVFKTLVVALDTGELVCAAIPSDARLSLKAIASAAGAKRAELAAPEKAERATGYVVGGISPFGQRRRLRLFVDASALAHPEIVVNGGRRGLQLILAPSDLIAALEAKVGPLTAVA